MQGVRHPILFPSSEGVTYCPLPLAEGVKIRLARKLPFRANSLHSQNQYVAVCIMHRTSLKALLGGCYGGGVRLGTAATSAFVILLICIIHEIFKV